MVSRGIVFLVVLGLSACSTNRNLVYLNDLRGSSEFRTQILNNPGIRIQATDLLAITVSGTNPESSILFNSGVIAASSSANPIEANTANNAVDNKRVSEGYVVDKDGFINFAVLGKVRLAGLTREEAVQKMTAEVQKYIKNPVIDIRLLNFKVTVLGEVAKPASFNVMRESINVLEALGMAGDMTAFGKRENVLIIREKDGVRTVARVNLADKAVLDSPYFYLQQNDVVYVEPDNRTKLAQTDPANRFIPIWGAIISTIGFAIITFAR